MSSKALAQAQSTQTTFLVTLHVQFHSIQEPYNEKEVALWLTSISLIKQQPDLGLGTGRCTRNLW